MHLWDKVLNYRDMCKLCNCRMTLTMPSVLKSIKNIIHRLIHRFSSNWAIYAFQINCRNWGSKYKLLPSSPTITPGAASAHHTGLAGQSWIWRISTSGSRNTTFLSSLIVFAYWASRQLHCHFRFLTALAQTTFTAIYILYVSKGYFPKDVLAVLKMVVDGVQRTVAWGAEFRNYILVQVTHPSKLMQLTALNELMLGTIDGATKLDTIC